MTDILSWPSWRKETFCTPLVLVRQRKRVFFSPAGDMVNAQRSTPEEHVDQLLIRSVNPLFNFPSMSTMFQQQTVPHSIYLNLRVNVSFK